MIKRIALLMLIFLMAAVSVHYFSGNARARLSAAHPQKVICEDGEEFFLEAQKPNARTPVSHISETDLIVIDTQTFHLTLYRSGKVFRTYPVAIGEPETPSPIGEWKIIHKGGNWGNGFGMRWMGLNVPWGIYGIHGTNKPWTIGTKASHGCIRMFDRNVLELYDLVKVGTPVHIIGQLPKVNPRKEVARNNTGRDIVAMQFALRETGFDPGMVDGRFGVDMEQAVFRLQVFYGLPKTGKIGLNEQYLLKLR
jgi:hypothetical protein